MTVSVQSPEDVVNAALTRIGATVRVANMMEGSHVANAAADIYGQTRDELLRQDDWAFAARNAALTLLKSAPIGGYIPPTVWSSAYPPLPWIFEYAYPADCLKVRTVKPATFFVPNFDPQPHSFGLENDNSLVPPAKVILSNVADAIVVYTGRVTDPATWEADFTEAAIAAIARRLAPKFGPQAMQVAVPDEAAAKNTAELQQG